MSGTGAGDGAPAGGTSHNPPDLTGENIQPPTAGVEGLVIETGVHEGDAQGSRLASPIAPRPAAPVPPQGRTGATRPGSVVVPPELDEDRVLSGVTLRDLSSLFTAWTEAAAAANADRPERTIDITRGDLPKWNHEKDHFTTFERRVVMWMRSHDIEHLLEKYPESHETSLHKKAMLVITNQLKEDDAKTVHHIAHLCDVWAFLTGKYHPSDEADRARLWQRFDTITKGNRPVKNYHSEMIFLVAQLTALG